MFGSNNSNGKTDNGKAKSGAPAAAAGGHSLNSINQGTTVEGTIRAQSDIRIDGTIKGNLMCDAKVIIGPTGFVEGEIQCDNAVIEGKFEGTLRVKELLNVRETAVINGDVSTGKLIVQPGGVFNVSCNMNSSSAGTGINTAAPRKDKADNRVKADVTA